MKHDATGRFLGFASHERTTFSDITPVSAIPFVPTTFLTRAIGTTWMGWFAPRHRQIHGSLPVAKRTAEVLRLVISSEKGASKSTLIDAVRHAGSLLQSSAPLEVSIGNITKRVLHIIRDEAAAVLEEAGGVSEDAGKDRIKREASTERMQNQMQELSLGDGIQKQRMTRLVSLHNLLDQVATKGSSADEKIDSARRERKLKHNVIEAISDLMDELEGLRTLIAEQAGEHIHAKETILTMGSQRTVESFLLDASKKRSFQLVVAEGAPLFTGHKLARDLAEAGIPTTLISDSAVFAMMARINKVIVSAHAVLANGGIIAAVGTRMLAMAAAKHAVPFVVLTGLHKLTPIFPQQSNMVMNDFFEPDSLIAYDALADLQINKNDNLQIPNPGFDYVPPHLVSLFVTDTGGISPTYVYRLLKEFYSPVDYD